MRVARRNHVDKTGGQLPRNLNDLGRCVARAEVVRIVKLGASTARMCQNEHRCGTASSQCSGLAGNHRHQRRKAQPNDIGGDSELWRIRSGHPDEANLHSRCFHDRRCVTLRVRRGFVRELR